jgi:hypothetical protein
MLLAGVEVLAVSVNFLLLFLGYFRWFSNRFVPSLLMGGGGTVIVLTVPIAFLGFSSFLAVAYVKRGGWARLVFLAENGGLVLLGALWFAVHAARHNVIEPRVTVFALVVPLLTLFPLMWPLLVFRPTMPEEVMSGT